MSYTARIPETEITGIYGGLLKVAMRKLVGEVPESARIMWQNPRVFKDLMGVARKAERWHEVDPSLASLAGMAAASRVGCGFCLDLGYFMAHNKGLDETKAREVPRWQESDVFTPLERRVMEFADAMSQTPPAVSNELARELLEELGAAALLELTARIGLQNLTARANLALGIRSQEFAEACGLPPLAARSANVAS
jgi:alkylhydroperoxidase family enzyme